MSLGRARIIKAPSSLSAAPTSTAEFGPALATRGRRLPREILAARDEASRIVARAQVEATKLVEHARSEATTLRADVARRAREEEVARVAADILVARARHERTLAAGVEHTIQIATALAERLVGETLKVEPERIAALAAEALQESRGARQVRIEANPLDVPALSQALTAVEWAAEVVPARELTRGSLVVQTELGKVDARLKVQLASLAQALRDVLTNTRIPIAKGISRA